MPALQSLLADFAFQNWCVFLKKINSGKKYITGIIFLVEIEEVRCIEGGLLSWKFFLFWCYKEAGEGPFFRRGDSQEKLNFEAQLAVNSPVT